MARVALPKVTTAGVYAHLRHYFEDDLQTWERNGSWVHATVSPFPRQRILDDLRAGRTVNVPTYALPRSAFEGAPSRPGPPVVHGLRRGQLSVRHPERAIVTPDDRITFTNDDWARLFLEECGL
jgi:hypothetical protein